MDGDTVRRWCPIKIVWRDAFGSDDGWQDPKELRHKPTKVTTVGLLYKQTDVGVMVVHNRNHGFIGGYTFIPTSNIVSITELAPKE
jgi:hypothetical protein